MQFERKNEKFEQKPSLGHISTFGGNPVVSSAALSVLEAIENEKILEKMKKRKTNKIIVKTQENKKN